MGVALANVESSKRSKTSKLAVSVASVGTAALTFTLDETLGFLKVGRNARTISFQLARDVTIRVTIVTRSGDILRTVARGPRTAGTVTARWNGQDGRRKRVPSGSYVVHVAATSPIGLSDVRVPVRIRR